MRYPFLSYSISILIWGFLFIALGWNLKNKEIPPAAIDIDSGAIIMENSLPTNHAATPVIKS
jgi:hypothetical protein